MPKTYADELTTSLSRVRFLALDTRESTAWFTDDEVNGAIDSGGSEAAGAAILLRRKGLRMAARGNPGAQAYLDEADRLDPNASRTLSLKTNAPLPFDSSYEPT